LIFTNRHGQDLGDNPQDADFSWNEDLESDDAYSTRNTGVFLDTDIAKIT
jgi:hypothetical protein